MSKKVLIIVIVGILLLVGGVGAGFYVVLNKVSQIALQAQTGQDEKDAEEVEEPESKVGLIYDLDTFVVNLADKPQQRFIRISMSLEYNAEEMKDEIENRLPQIKDAILMILPSKSYTELNQAKGKIVLREELIAQINNYFDKETIKNIYFTEFVIQ